MSTPGTATWETFDTPTGTKTVFTISDDTVFNWDTLNLDTGSELVFDFVGGESVTNYLGGSSTNFINGDVTSNGIVGFFSPHSDLIVNGNITAKGVTLSSLGADAIDFIDGGSLSLLAASATADVRIGGNIRATDGDVLIAGNLVSVKSGATIEATNRVMVAGGQEAVVAGSGDRRLSVIGDSGFVLLLGETRASRIEVSAGSEIINRGVLGEGNNRVFLEVNSDTGTITNESSGLIVNDAVFDGLFENGGILFGLHTDNAPSAVSDATLKIPTLKRPDGSRVSDSRTVSYSAPMNATGDAARDRKKPAKTVARRDTSNSILSRASFFGFRGGSAKGKKD
ncbi:hypothetical protein HAHE_42540 [Haloferula helveola]|uniref:Uncharacterized protein n=1 Tax=Haloferula helveola TaxID=490095 RepID=A0ABN6H9L9_9BACT|nr:hypothetical protein HAHE_42540 [Haloferula helveola]